MGSMLLIFFVFRVYLLCVIMFRVPCCDARYDFRKNDVRFVVTSSFSRRTHVLFTSFVFVLRIVVSNTYCVVFPRPVYPILSVSLDCAFLIAPFVFSNVDVYYA